MSDHDQISEVMARYAWHVDHGEWDAWIGLFSADGSWRAGDFGPFVGADGLTKLAGILGERIAGKPSRHLMTNTLVDLDGDKARLRSYILLVATDTKSLGTLGEYDIALSRQGGRWLIDTLEFTRLG